MPTDLTGTPTRGNAGLVDILDRVLDKGLVVAGDIKVSLAEVELLTIRIRLMICSIDKAEEIGLDWWKYDRHLSPGPRAGAAGKPRTSRAAPAARAAGRVADARLRPARRPRDAAKTDIRLRSLHDGRRTCSRRNKSY